MAAKRHPRNVAVRRAPEPERRRRFAAFWSDKERRRALLLSLLLHAGVLLGVVWLYLAPERQPTEELIVLELTPPEVGASEREAAAVDDPAPQAPDTQVAGNAAEDVAAPEAPAETPAEALEEPVEAQQQAEAPAETPAPPSERPPQARPPDRAALPTPALPTDLPTEAPASTLPEIEAVEVAPQPLEDAITLPTPNPEAAVTPSRRVAVTPQVALSESRALPTPDVSATVATQEVALPPVQAEVAPADAIPQPAVQAVVARAVPQPQAGAVVAPAQAVPRPAVSAAVASRAVPEPQVGAVVSAAQGIPQPAASGSVTPAENIPQPQAGAVVAEAQPLAVTPGVALSGAVPVVTPEAAATVTLPEPPAAPAAPAVTETGTAGGGADAGDGARSAQADPAATADAQGAASDGDGVADAGVANVQSFEVAVERPLAVLLDNADAAYPQQGLVEASSVFEMPVEGGLTRLMSVYTRSDPAQVGPIRSARDYFLEAALEMNGTLVHVGGEPSTVSRIASQDLATVDALQEGTLFAQAPDRLAPHSTFSTGTALRDAVGSLENSVSGTLYVPPGDAPDASSVSVDYSADYTSGFRYLPDLDRYRWVRSGADAADAAGTAVTVDAVVVAQVIAFPKSGDLEGRLYLPYSGGAATLYLRGKAIPGSWTPAGGFTFQTESGAEVDLTPFKHWILFAPETAEVSAG